MAKMKEGEQTMLLNGKFYSPGDDLPEDYGKYPPKTRPKQAAPAPAPATPNMPDQTNRPGMSGSGESAGKDEIVTERGHVTHPEQPDEFAAGNSESARELDESETEVRDLSHVDRVVREELAAEENKGSKRGKAATAGKKDGE